MIIEYFAKGALIGALFAVCISCSKPCQRWQFDQTITCCPCFNSGKIYLTPQCTFGEIELEVAQGPCEQRMYLNVFALEIPSDPHDPERAKVFIIFENHESIVYGYKLQGGQRLLLPPEAALEITEALLDDQSFEIRVGRFRSTICPDHFAESYSKLISIPLS
jgi:hypothetical protein